MKKVLYTTALTLFVSVSHVWGAQAQAVNPASVSEQGNSIAPATSGGASSNKSEKTKKNEAKSNKARSEQKEKTTPATASATPVSNPANSIGIKSTSTVASDGAKSAPGASAPSPAAAMTNIYRVGIGDVLDIRLVNAPTRSSTLYTVLPGGLLEYPLAGDPFNVVGLTTDEIAERLSRLIKIYEKPQVTVNVREYQSHSVILTGLVNDPGLKYLKREAVPLYVIMMEAQPRAEAARAVIMRQGSPNIAVDLSDTNAMATLVLPGDVIKLSAALPQFYFIGGAITDPGQKSFHTGLTLTQAVLAAGGTTRFAGSDVKVSRQGADGKLVTTKYNLKKIEEGKIPDPLLQPGDRIEVTRGGW